MLEVYRVNVFSIGPPPLKRVLDTWFNIDNYGQPLNKISMNTLLWSLLIVRMTAPFKYVKQMFKK